MEQETKSNDGKRYNGSGYKNRRFIFWRNLLKLHQAEDVTTVL